MRIVLVLCALLFALPAWSVENPLPGYERQARALMEESYSQSDSLPQVEARQLLTRSLEAVDKLLNAAYKETIQNLDKKDAELAGYLRNEQRAWLKFVENFCHKEETGFGEGGTMYVNIALSAKLRFWVERIAFLRIVNRNVVSESNE